MKSKIPFLCVLLLAFAGLSTTAAAEDCYDDVCVDFSDVGGYYLLSVTDVDDGSPLEVQMTDIPSNTSPGGGTPPTEPYSAPPARGSVALPNQAGDDYSDTITYTFHGTKGRWVVSITLVYNGDGDLVDVDANVIYIPNENEQQ